MNGGGGEGMTIGNTSKRLFTVGGLVTKVGMSVRPMAFVIICIKGILAPYPKDIVGTSFPQPIRNTELTTLVLISY